MARVSLHFSSSHGIQLDLSRPYPLHENFSPSRGIYRLNLCQCCNYQLFVDVAVAVVDDDVAAVVDVDLRNLLSKFGKNLSGNH